MISKHFEHNSCCSRIGENDLGAARIGLAVSFGKNGETTRPPPLPSPQGGGEHFVPALSAICGRSGEEGTTLLELLVAIALLALLCTYSFDAIRHLQSFNRAIREIEEANSIEAVAAHMRRTIAGSRVAFFTAPGSQARLAFAGEESRIALVGDADSRLELGGLYLVEIALKQGDEGKKSLIAFRRAFRPSMIVDPGGDEPILLSDQVSSLSFRYFGSPEKQAEAAWYPSWTSAKLLPSAVEVAVISSRGHPWPPLLITIPAAQ